MEDKETTSPESDGQCDFLPSNGSELDGRTKAIADSKLCPTDPVTISQIKREEKHQNVREITVRIREKLVSRKFYIVFVKHDYV